jgi:hypothetical protein
MEPKGKDLSHVAKLLDQKKVRVVMDGCINWRSMRRLLRSWLKGMREGRSSSPYDLSCSCIGNFDGVLITGGMVKRNNFSSLRTENRASDIEKRQYTVPSGFQ